MRDEAEFLTQISRGLSREAFMADETLKRAFTRSIEVIGEAAKEVPDSVRQRHQQVEWQLMTGMRDRLIHGYFGVDYEIVWEVAAEKAPNLQRQLELIIGEEEKRDS
jgi:uncharacterized protein with HEPN domain